MMLTVTQATAVNRLVDFFAPHGDGAVTAEAARDALALLADDANKKLMAGAHGETVRANWLTHIESDIRTALEGDSNDDEHDALTIVAEALGIKYEPIEQLANDVEDMGFPSVADDLLDGVPRETVIKRLAEIGEGDSAVARRIAGVA